LFSSICVLFKSYNAIYNRVKEFCTGKIKNIL
jgi:hypothetical protein